MIGKGDCMYGSVVGRVSGVVKGRSCCASEQAGVVRSSIEYTGIGKVNVANVLVWREVLNFRESLRAGG